MIEILSLKEFLMLFGFSMLEMFILLMFAKIVENIKGIKVWHIFIFSIVTIICVNINFPFLKQIFLFFSMILYLYFVSKEHILKLIKVFFTANIYLLFFEVISSIIYENIFNIEFSKAPIYNRLILLIPARIIQILILYILWRKNTLGMVWFGGIKEVKKNKEVVKEEVKEKTNPLKILIKKKKLKNN